MPAKNKTGIRLLARPFRGGAFNGDQSMTGVCALSLHYPRSSSSASVGFRSALFQSKIGIRLLVMPFRGGGFTTGGVAGVFALNVRVPRSYSNSDGGFRSALFQSNTGTVSYTHLTLPTIA